VLHVWAATVLTIENKVARGPEPYGVAHTIRATLSSRTMRQTGVVVLAFVFYHLAQFTWGVADTSHFKENLARYTMQSEYRVAGFPVVKAGTEVLRRAQHGDSRLPKPDRVPVHIVAVGLLSFHLLHGIESMFQTLGWRSNAGPAACASSRWCSCAAYFFFNLTIPGSVVAGRLKPQAAHTVAGSAR